MLLMYVCTYIQGILFVIGWIDLLPTQNIANSVHLLLNPLPVILSDNTLPALPFQGRHRSITRDTKRDNSGVMGGSSLLFPARIAQDECEPPSLYGPPSS